MDDAVGKFEKWLRLGLGRCFVHLAHCGDVNAFRESLLKGCLTNPSPYTQSEGTRAKYLHELTQMFDGEDYFLTPVIDKLSKTRDEFGWNYAHLCDLVYEFAASGNEAAVSALQNEYRCLYNELVHKPSDDEDYDAARDNYERVAVALVRLKGVWTTAALFEFFDFAEDMGKLFELNPRYSARDFEWFYDSFADAVGRQDLDEQIRIEFSRNPYLRIFYDSLNEEKHDGGAEQPRRAHPAPAEIIETYDGAEPNPNYRYVMSRIANGDELSALARRAVSETDESKKANLLHLFGGGCPIDDDILTVYAESDNRGLKEAALEILQERRSEKLHGFALRLLKCGDDLKAYGLIMLINNFRPEDEAVLSDNLDEYFSRPVPDDEQERLEQDGYREIVLSAVCDECSGENRLPGPVWNFVYENALMASQREFIVKFMHGKRCLKKEIILECAFDCNEDIRELATSYAAEV